MTENKLLDVILSDTASSFVSYLPIKYNFNISHEGSNYFMLLKSGKNIYLLKDGSHQLYMLKAEAGKTDFVRIDSSKFSGDNFTNMALIRKDTLYQYGGYGFWRNRDFFTRYRPPTHDWEFITGGNGLQNTMTYNYYNASEDAFYVVGSNQMDAHKDFITKLRDSIYRYDFKTKTWRTMGPFHTRSQQIIMNSFGKNDICATPFGLIDFRTIDAMLWDFQANRIFYLNESKRDLLYPIDKKNLKYDKKFRSAVYLNDTLFVIEGSDNDAFLSKIPLQRSDFNISSGVPIYKESKKWQFFSLQADDMQLFFLSFGILASLSFFIFLVSKRNLFRNHLRDTPEPYELRSAPLRDNDTGVQEPLVLGTELPEVSDLDFFFASLVSVEKDLLISLIQSTLKQEKLNTDHINRILGVSVKDQLVQKARRSMAITNINISYEKTMKLSGPLIVRERHNLDKRSFLYEISGKHLDRVRHLLR